MKLLRSTLSIVCWLALGMGFTAVAATKYVSPAGGGLQDGSTWADAYTNLQDALNICTGAGDTIYLRYGSYTNIAGQLAVADAADLTICGGYAGTTPEPGATTNLPTILRAQAGSRVLYATNSTLTLSALTLSGGNINTTNAGSATITYAAGLLAQGCNVVLTNCAFLNNSSLAYGGFAGNWNAYNYGGGLASVGGSAAADGCLFSNNMSIVAYNNGNYSANYGGAIYASGSNLTIRNTVFKQNQATYQSGPANYAYGGAIYSSCSGTLISNCLFSGNSAYANQSSFSTPYGGALYLAGATATVACNTFSNNYVYGNYVSTYLNGQGGCVYASGCGQANFASNYFINNYVGGLSTVKNGSVFYVSGCGTCQVANCVIESTVNPYAEYFYITGVGNCQFIDSVIQNNPAYYGVYVASAGSASLAGCRVANNAGGGVYWGSGKAALAHSIFATNGASAISWQSGGLVALTNCLFVANAGNGLTQGAGTATVANCTFVGNNWGLNQTAGTGAVVNSIAWDNGAGGFTSNANLMVSYSCSQSGVYGNNNTNGDPLFVNAPGYYYLAAADLTNQPSGSPYCDWGGGNASDYGLDVRTTRTDGSNDTGAVDLGYHYANGLADELVLPPPLSNCFVDAVSGSDTNSGAGWGTAWKTLTKALLNVAASGTINVAAGTYNTTNGESFPLTIRSYNLKLAGTNRNSTLIDGEGISGRCVLKGINKGNLVIAGVTIKGGNNYASGGNPTIAFAGGLQVQGCALTLTNCAVINNSSLAYGGLTAHWNAYDYGGGLSSIGGSATIDECLFGNNASKVAYNVAYYSANYGGAIYASGSMLTIRNTVFQQNQTTFQSTPANYTYGGAVYSSCLGTMISNCVFNGNSANANQSSFSTPYGGALYLAGSTVTVACSTFSNNYTYGNYGSPYLDGQGGCVYVSGCGQASFSSNYFINNYVGGTSTQKYGAVFYINGCGTCQVAKCVIESWGNPYVEYVYVNGGGRIDLLGSTLRNNSASRGIYCAGNPTTILGVTNCLVSGNKGDGLYVGGGTALVVNCTFAGNTNWGINNGGVLAVKNSILWTNGLGGIATNTTTTVNYTDSQDGWVTGLGPGNKSVDPLFVSPATGDYHEQSKGGSWHNDVNDFVPDLITSPCLDAGDPSDSVGDETSPNGNIINMGAYGGTPWASRTKIMGSSVFFR